MELTKDTITALVQSDNEFPVDLDDAWRWVGWPKKQKAKHVLLNNFVEGLDFLTKGFKSPEGGRPSEFIVLSVDCFKSLGMMAGTEKGKEIRRYFLECEREMKRLQVEQPRPTIEGVEVSEEVKAEVLKDFDFNKKVFGIDYARSRAARILKSAYPSRDYPYLPEVTSNFQEVGNQKSLLQEFVESCLNLMDPFEDRHVQVSSADMYSAYQKFCLAARVRPVANSSFTGRLRKLIPDYCEHRRRLRASETNQRDRQGKPPLVPACWAAVEIKSNVF